MTHPLPGIDVALADPADVWDAYCAEVPFNRRSPQGALAFGFEAALRSVEPPGGEVREAPESCPNCFDRSDCSNVDICKAVEEVYRPAAPLDRNARREQYARCLVNNDPNYRCNHMPGDEPRPVLYQSGWVSKTKPLSEDEAERVRIRADALLALDSNDGAAQREVGETYTEICMNEKCPRGGRPVEVVRATPALSVSVRSGDEESRALKRSLELLEERPAAALRALVIEECANVVGEMRQSEAGIFDAAHSGQRGEDRSNALYDAYQAIRRLAGSPS